MSIDGTPETPFALSAEDLARLDAIREGMLDPSPRRIGRLDQWGLADEYETYAETAGYREFSIAMADGTMIDAALSIPRNLAPGQTCPAVVMPAPLIGIGRNAYLGMFPRWARGGYAVLAYSQRGLAESGGEIHVAGPQDVADGIEIINALVQIEGVDPDRIGFFGSSYGAGTSLLVAAKDPRVKAVVGTSAWGDLFASLYENGTRHLKAFEALVRLFGEERCSKEFRGIIEKIRNNTIDDEVREFARVRSPRHHLKAYNDARTPILLTTAWHETIFSVPAVVDLFTGLQGPKSLLVQVGDHGNGELPGLTGLISKPTEMAYRWMDHHLGGTVGDGAAPQFGIRSEYMHNLLSELRHDSWADYALPRKRFHLAGAAAGRSDARLAEGQPQPGWSRSVRATGWDTAVVVAPKLVQTGLVERLGMPHVYRTAGVDRELAAIWTTAPLQQPMRVQGDLELRVTVTPRAMDATIVAYLLDCDPATGTARIITHAPYTLTNKQAGQATTVTFPLQPAHYVLARGRVLQLVIGTHDQFFADANSTPTSIEFTSPQGAESYLDIPLGTLD
ncbi:CocE/NonD family hydrolase [Kitasatospora sp. NPDC058048]|uniref:CocE/NonD family hydrolase n=1 Tax=Kitasatospora sp. NPDC058048 TaxID=3346313 RepID=UPI0036DDE6FF